MPIARRALNAVLRHEIVLQPLNLGAPPFVTTRVFLRDTRRHPAELSAAVAKTIYSIDPDITVSLLSTMNEVRDQLFIGDRFTMMLYVGFAFLALALAAIGVYGVISFGVSRRTQEIAAVPDKH